jgi:exodeoxyribonuclease VII small subunit
MGPPFFCGLIQRDAHLSGPKALTPLRCPVTEAGMADDPKSITALSFEEALKELESIVARLESGDASLDQSIDLYTRGEALRSQCEKRLKDAQARIEKISLSPDGTPNGTTAFDAG